MKNTNKFITAIVVLLVSVTSIAFSVAGEAEFGIRINFLSIIEIEKISDVNFGTLSINEVTEGQKASGEFEVTGVNEVEVYFYITGDQELKNGDNTIPIRTYVSDQENGGEQTSATLSNTGKFRGYLVTELGEVTGIESGEYTGTVNVEVSYD